MFRSALYEIAHDYAILGEDSGDEDLKCNYLENSEQPELITKPINQHFQNFSKLLQTQKEKQMRKVLTPIDTNLPTQQARLSPRKYFQTPQVRSIEKIMKSVYNKHRSTNATPKTYTNQFYDNQIRWLNRVKQNIQVKEKIQKQRIIMECPFRPQTTQFYSHNRSKSKIISTVSVMKVPLNLASPPTPISFSSARSELHIRYLIISHHALDILPARKSWKGGVWIS